MIRTIRKMISDTDRRRDADAKRHEELDWDLCQLCGAYGADKRTLVLRYFYAIYEVLPEAIDLHAVEGREEDGYLLRTCKVCRGEFLGMLAEWRAQRIATRGTPKDHDGYPSEDEDEERNIPYREHGRTVYLTHEEWQERRNAPTTAKGPPND